MVDLNALTNLTPLNINMTLINDTTNLIPNLISNANTVTDNNYGLAVMILLFIGLLFITYKETGDIRLDVSRSMLVASGVVTVIGLIALYSRIFYSFQHVGWFFLIFLLNLIFIYIQKKKQQ